jgi:radical SAM protein with 4Fe4S-binding SPASM domain
LGIHVHTNTTLCADNIDVAEDLIRFVARDLGSKLLSMNMLIPTGVAVNRPELGVRYEQVGIALPRLITAAQAERLRLVWYSPVPYCLFNPVLHGLGAKACACVDGILSVNPAGEVLPCSSFATGLGSLLDRSFDRVYGSRAARYWREKRYVPPACHSCPHVDICGGACPLYWDAAGGFDELPGGARSGSSAHRRWAARRKQGGSFGVPAPSAGER